jgi:hypothetical protein
LFMYLSGSVLELSGSKKKKKIKKNKKIKNKKIVSGAIIIAWGLETSHLKLIHSPLCSF